ncbi:MAG: hypothetical protein ACT4N2_11960 [Hyphomicrobium sp.]
MLNRLSAMFLAAIASAPALAAPTDFERGVALAEPGLMQALDIGGFGLGSMLRDDWPANKKLSNGVLAAMSEIQIIRTTLAREFDTHLAELRRERCALPGATRPACENSVGVDLNSVIRVFDKRFLTTFYARFQLVGIVNRMDRAFITPGTCGEVRLLYRLNYSVPKRPASGSQPKREAVSSRLPMTINLVLKAKAEGDAAVSCKEIAESWLWAGERTSKGEALLGELRSPRGPLRFIRRALVDRAEINLQLDRWPTQVEPNRFIGGHAEYLLRVFKRRVTARPGGGMRESYEVARLENQIDQRRILADSALKRRLRAFLLEPRTIEKLDAGTIMIGEEFLAERAISVTPGNFARAANRPFEGILDDGAVTAALAGLPDGMRLKRVSTMQSFQHRLNDITCSGCHQTRAVGGFQFMGHQWDRTLKANSVVLPASPHFFGDVHRRRHIIEAFAADRPRDY